uniref:Exocyst complex component 3-like 1 n=1 Tax=Tetraodon nigroviridis TaxID=99883 RepID=H3BZ57_TETNG
VEQAECLARGAALKWASGVFCRPEHLEHLTQYKKRESQRINRVHTRLKSMVQSYLEGVGWGLEQLQEAGAVLMQVSQALKKTGLEASHSTDGVRSLEKLREVSVHHRLLLTAVSNLPRLYSVRRMVLETERLVESRRLLEAHAHLMDLEQWQDEILWQLCPDAGMATSALSSEDQELVAKYFSGVGKLVDALGKEMWAVVSSALVLAQQNPTPFVSAVRIVEREEAMDRVLLEERDKNSRSLPPQRPRCWRASFFQVFEEGVSARFRSVSFMQTRGPGLAGHLSALQHGIMADLATVCHLLEHCVPSHYQLTGAYLRAIHQCLHNHLAQVSSWELESGEIFAVLNWVLHIYNRTLKKMRTMLAPYEDMESKYEVLSAKLICNVRGTYLVLPTGSVQKWMYRALQVELQDWQRDQEPDTDHEGFYQTSLPTIITQMLEENARVALMIGEALRDQTIQMGLYEMEKLLNRFREALVEFGKQHHRLPSNNKFHLHYLLASISNCIILKKSTESLQQQQSSCSMGQFFQTPPNPLAALDRAVRKACSLVMDQLLLDLQPFLPSLLTRPWLVQGDPTPKLCRILECHLELYGRVRPPCRQVATLLFKYLYMEDYIRSLWKNRFQLNSILQSKLCLVKQCRNYECVRIIFTLVLAGEGVIPDINPLALLSVLADFVQLKDPAMLTLEVSGLASKYPDISEEHVSVLLDIRGDVSRDIRWAVLDLLEQSASPLPVGYRPIFTDILVPPAPMTFCFP